MERLTIGEVLKPQGIRGELKIKTFTDFPEDVKAFGTVLCWICGMRPEMCRRTSPLRTELTHGLRRKL